MNAKEKEICESVEKQRDGFQNLIDSIRENEKNTKIWLLEQSNQWLLTLASISIGLAAAIAPILFSSTQGQVVWSPIPFYLGVLVLLLNGVTIFVFQKIILEDDLNKAPHTGKLEELNLIKLRNSANKVLWYKNDEHLKEYTDLQKTIQSEETSQRNSILQKRPRIKFTLDRPLFFLIMGSYLLFSRIWPWQLRYFITFGLFLLACFVLLAVISYVVARNHNRKTIDIAEKIGGEENSYMEWWRDVHDNSKTKSKN